MSGRPGADSSQRGAILLELLLSSAVSMMVMTGVFMLFDSMQDTYVDRIQVLENQQAGRIAVEQLRRDLHATGVGLAWTLPPTPLVIPRPDGGVDLRENVAGLASALRSDMASSGDAVEVFNASGFAVNDTMAIYDAGGMIDYVTVTAVDLANHRIHHSGAGKAFQTAQGAAVARIRTVSYFVQDIGGVQTLVRAVDGGAPQPLAQGVVEFTLTYRDNSVPPMVFTPDTVAEQTRIKTVEMTLVMRSPMPGGDPFPEHEVRVVNRVTPRALALS